MLTSNMCGVAADVKAAGRFAPSPSGDLHLGNLRTAILAWLFARSTHRRFLIRMEDLDRVKVGAAQRQIADLKAMGLDWDGPVIYQSSRMSIYREVIEWLRQNDLVYPCFCTRKEILAAPSAPHTPPGAYPGTCRHLSRMAVTQKEAEGRPPALRLRSQATSFTIKDTQCGSFTGPVDDFVVQRNDGTPAYNLAVVIDDDEHGVDQVVRGDDLLTSAPRQAYLAHLLDCPAPVYSHVPMILAPDGRRLAKRDGAITMDDIDQPLTTTITWLTDSLGLTDGTYTPISELVDGFDPCSLPREPTYRAPA